MHVFDAARSVPVATNLLDKNKKQEFVSEIKELYDEIREDYYENLTELKYLTLEDARKNRLILNDYNIPKPTFLGYKVLKNISLKELENILIGVHFSIWQLRGKYPNRGYPKIFNDDE